MPLVTLRNIALRFGGPPLLDGVTCHVEAGQRIGLLGRNGAGKTSLMRLLAGVIPVSYTHLTLPTKRIV